MKRYMLSTLLVALTLSTGLNAETNEELIASLPELDRMVACAQAHDSWQYNAPDAKQADAHRVKSSSVMNEATKKFGPKAYWKLAEPVVQAFQLTAMNRDSLVLEPQLCKGFGPEEKFTKGDTTPSAAYPSHWTQEHIALKKQISTFTGSSQYQELMHSGTVMGEAVRAYMCWNAYAADELQANNYVRYIDQKLGTVKVLEEVLNGEKIFDDLYKRTFESNSGMFIDEFCGDANKSFENLVRVSQRYSGFDYFNLIDKTASPVVLNLLCHAMTSDERYITKARESSMSLLSDQEITNFLDSRGVGTFADALETRNATNSFIRSYCQ